MLVDDLENSGQWQQALLHLRRQLASGQAVNDEGWHQFGRLLQRLCRWDSARRAYKCALNLNSARPRTLNNLALIELQLLNSLEAERWLSQALALEPLSIDEEDLLQATACDLYLYQLRPALALAHVEQQLARKVSVMGLANQAICFQKLFRLQEAVQVQEQAVRLYISTHAPQLSNAPLVNLIGVACGSPHNSMQLQVQMMNLAIYRLCDNPSDAIGLQMLLAGTSNDLNYWQDPRRAITCWDGLPVDELIIWDDQGFGDTIQNLYWIVAASRRVKHLRIWLRPSLVEMVRLRMELPSNCILEILSQDSCPWAAGSKQIGFFFLPMVLKQWSAAASDCRPAYLKRNQLNITKPIRRIGLVWSAGHHKAPQPERSARVRDVPREKFFQLAQIWGQSHAAVLLSLQLDGHTEDPAQKLIDNGVLVQALKSTDWQQTASIIDSLDLLVTVDTSVAHLAAAMGLPAILLLNRPADWRWGQDGNASFLYKSMRIARCNKPDDWGGALDQANYLVNEFFGKANAPSAKHFSNLSSN